MYIIYVNLKWINKYIFHPSLLLSLLLFISLMEMFLSINLKKVTCKFAFLNFVSKDKSCEYLASLLEDAKNEGNRTSDNKLPRKKLLNSWMCNKLALHKYNFQFVIRVHEKRT